MNEGSPVVLMVSGMTDQAKLNVALTIFARTHGRPTKLIYGAEDSAWLGIWAAENGIPVETFCLPLGGKAARNYTMTLRCTHLVAFPSEKESGTQHAISCAQGYGKHVTVWKEDDTPDLVDDLVRFIGDSAKAARAKELLVADFTAIALEDNDRHPVIFDDKGVLCFKSDPLWSDLVLHGVLDLDRMMIAYKEGKISNEKARHCLKYVGYSLSRYTETEIFNDWRTTPLEPEQKRHKHM